MMIQLLLFTLLSFHVAQAELIEMEASIDIDAPIEKVFQFAGDARNDALWRSEVHDIVALGPFFWGTMYREDAWLGLHYNYITHTFITWFKPPYAVTYKSSFYPPYNLISDRNFEALNSGKTRFIYHVTVEKKLVADIWGEHFPVVWAQKGYKQLMQFYLNRLKKVLERP